MSSLLRIGSAVLLTGLTCAALNYSPDEIDALKAEKAI